MIYTILVAHVADPLPPSASSHRYVTRLPLCGVPASHPVALSWGLLMYEGNNSLSVTERIQCHSFSAIIHPSIVSTQSTVESVRLSAMG